MTLITMTFSVTTQSIMTFSLTTLRIVTFSKTINKTEHSAYGSVVMLGVILSVMSVTNKFPMLRVIMLNVIVLSVVAPQQTI